MNKSLKIKHISKKALHKKAWKLFSEYIRRSSGGVCFTCGVRKDWKELDASHYIHNKLDFDEVNIHACCSRCNRFLHGNLGIYAERLIAEYGEEAIMRLRMRSHEVRKFSIDDLENIIANCTIVLSYWGNKNEINSGMACVKIGVY